MVTISKTCTLKPYREDTHRIGEQVEKLSLEAFYNNVRETDKVLIVSGLLQQIGDIGPESSPYSAAWDYFNNNKLRVDEFKSFDTKLDKIYLVFTNFNHRFSIENHFMELRKANKAKVNTTRPQVSMQSL